MSLDFHTFFLLNVYWKSRLFSNRDLEIQTFCPQLAFCQGLAFDSCVSALPANKTTRLQRKTRSRARSSFAFGARGLFLTDRSKPNLLTKTSSQLNLKWWISWLFPHSWVISEDFAYKKTKSHKSYGGAWTSRFYSNLFELEFWIFRNCGPSNTGIKTLSIYKGCALNFWNSLMWISVDIKHVVMTKCFEG